MLTRGSTYIRCYSTVPGIQICQNSPDTEVWGTFSIKLIISSIYIKNMKKKKMTELPPSNSKYKHFTRMLNKNFSNCFKSICRGLSDWSGRYLKLTCTREKLEILNHFSEMDFFAETLHCCSLESHLRKKRCFFFSLVHTLTNRQSPQGEPKDHKPQALGARALLWEHPEQADPGDHHWRGATQSGGRYSCPWQGIWN